MLMTRKLRYPKNQPQLQFFFHIKQQQNENSSNDKPCYAIKSIDLYTSVHIHTTTEYTHWLIVVGKKTRKTKPLKKFA